MKVKTITYSESRESMSPMGLKKWRKLEIGGELIEGETLKEAYNDAEKQVHELLNSNGAEVVLNTDFFLQTPITQPIPTKDISEERVGVPQYVIIIEEIDKCKSAEEVATFKQFTTHNNDIRQAYLNKLKQFV